MRVVFAGTPPFAAKALEALLASAHEVALVLTQPDRPAGRGMRLAASAVAQVAAARGIPTLKPASLRSDEATHALRERRPDVMVVAAYGLILPAGILAVPGRGCLNIHASLLPRWRGAAPIQRAILAGDRVTGISIMRMDAGLDTGAVLLQRTLEVGARETSGTLTESLAGLGARSVVEALAVLDTLVARPQDPSGVTYASKVEKREARIDWAQSNLAIDRRIRAFNPAPGAETAWGEESLKIWEAEPAEGSGKPGEVLASDADNLVIACGEAALRIEQVQRPGGRRMAARDFLRGTSLRRGALLASTPSAA